MNRPAFITLLALASGCLFLAVAQEGDVTFRSDVSLVRVDAQVIDRDNRAITGLRVEDFVLREDGKPREIRNFGSENMPVDFLLLLDVSASMRPHVERMASAAHQAFRALGEKDRVAIMVFDRSTRLRLPFRDNRDDVEREIERLLRQERFNGGTDITRGMLDATAYLAREGRRDARRAIVILTDDQTERDRDEEGVSRALENANAVLSALLAPDAMANRMGYPGGGGMGRRRGGMGGGIGGPLGGIILGGGGGGGPWGGGRNGGGMPRAGGGSRTQSAGTAEIARRSGGDSLQVDDASALETTLTRIRQRYALYFYRPEGAKPGQSLQVELSDAARRRYPDANVRYRQLYSQGGTTGGTTDSGSAPPEVTDAERPHLHRRPAGTEPTADTPASTAASDTTPASRPGWRRVDGPGGAPGPMIDTAGASSNVSAPAPAAAPGSGTDRPAGWR
ncbi:MAG: VWA domain-containing protein, partial [Acidobacteriota bacterium]|nr:VWA domain-containing protein [Acidobacteriota bacterium]